MSVPGPKADIRVVGKLEILILTVIPTVATTTLAADRPATASKASSAIFAASRNGLNTCYIEGQNVTVEYHWLEGQYDRLPALIGDRCRALARGQRTIPIVFDVGAR